MNKLFIALLLCSGIAFAQVPAPQLNLNGNVGGIGFPILNSGTINMSTDANLTLAISNVNTSCVSCKITSSVSLTATRSIIFPAGRFFLNVENATTGSQSITIIGPSGTGVTVPNGQTVSMWNDGTNYVQIGSSSGGGDTITSPSSTLDVGGTSSNTTLDLNLASANTWTAAQTFNDGLTIPDTESDTFTLTPSGGLGSYLTENTNDTDINESILSAGTDTATVNWEMDDGDGNSISMNETYLAGLSENLLFNYNYDFGIGYLKADSGVGIYFLGSTLEDSTDYIDDNNGGINFNSSGPFYFGIGTPNTTAATRVLTFELDDSGSGSTISWLNNEPMRIGSNTNTAAFEITGGTVPVLFPSGLTVEPISLASNTTNYNSTPFDILGSFWNGSASTNDDWSIVDVLGTGTNPTSTLTFAHSGSSGAHKIVIDNLEVSGTCTGCGSGSGNVSTSGTTTSGTIPVLNATTTITNSQLSDNGTTLTYAGVGGVSASSVTVTGTTPASTSWVAGTGSIPTLPGNAFGFAAPASGGTSYLFKPPATITAGILHAAAPAVGDGVNESVLTSGAVSLTTDVAGQLPLANIVALPLSCQPGVGDGLNAIPAGTYLQTTCKNETGQTWTLTAIRCVSDNSGSSTCNVTNGAGTGLLTGAITATSTYANGTQSGTTTIASGDYLKITFVADGTSKQIGIDVAGTY